MLHYLSLDTNQYAKPQLYDSRTNTVQNVVFAGARTFLQNYINNHKLEPISIYESHLPDRVQLVCWFYESESWQPSTKI